MNVRSVLLRPNVLLSGLLCLSAILFFGLSEPPEYKPCRGQRPPKPEFNGYPVGYGGETCRDLPLVDARIITNPKEASEFSRSQDKHQQGLHANPGDTIRILLWFHNSGSEERRTETTARNVRAGLMLDLKAAPTHRIKGFLSADNVETLTSDERGGDVQIDTDLPTTLEYVPDSALACLQRGDLLERGLSLTVSCGTFPEGKERYAAKITNNLLNAAPKIGDLKAGDQYSGYIQLHVKVTNPERHN